MAEADANIKFTADTAQALASIKDLQRSISTLYRSMSTSAASAQAAQAGMQQNLVNTINSSGKFTARLTTIRTTTESFTNALEKNKLSLGQYFRFGVASSKNFSKVFTTEFNTIDKVARERVKDLQTQYVKMGRDASGAMKAIAIRPTTLDMTNLGTQTAIAAQKQQLFNQLLKQGTTNLLNFGKNTQWAGRQLMVGFTIPLSIFAVQAARAFQNLEKEVINFRRVYGDLFTTPQETEAALKDVRGLALEFTKLGVAVEDTLRLAAKVAQMGNVGQDLVGQVTEATRLSVLGQMEQQEALDTTIGLTNAFGVSIEDLTGKVNFLNAAENQTILSIQDFNEAVPRAGSVVRQLGGDVEDLAFFMAAMREGGIEATQAANALKSSLGRLINPTEAAAGRLRSMGIDIKAIVETNAGDLQQTVIDLAFALDTLDPLDKARAIEQLFGKFQFARMSAMFQNIVEEGSQANRVLELMGLTAGELATIADRELGRVEESSATKFTSALERFKTELAPIGEEFLKMVTPIIEWATEMIAGFNKLGEGGRAFVVGFLGVIGGLAPVLLMVIGLVANLIANIAKGVGLAFKFFQKLTGGSKNLAEQTNYLNAEQIESETVAASLNQTHQTLTQTYTGEADALNGLAAAYRAAIQEMRSFNGPIMTAGGPMARVDGFAKGRKVPGYSSGVIEVPGPKGAGDIIPAMLAPGEAVIPADMAKRYGALINAMIAGNIPGFMAGRNAPQDRIESIGSQATASKRAGVLQLLTAEYQKALDVAGQEVANRFLVFMESVATDVTSITQTVLKDAMAQNQQLGYDMRGGASGATAFTHVGGKADVPIADARANMPALGLDTPARENLVTQFDPQRLLQLGEQSLEQLTGEQIALLENFTDLMVKLYHGLGVEISGYINNLMSESGADVDILLQDLQARNDSILDVYRKTIQLGGGDLVALSANQIDASGEEVESSSVLAEFHQRLQDNLRRLQEEAGEGVQLIIVDTQEVLEKERSKALAAGENFDSSRYIVFEEVFEQTSQEVATNLGSMGKELQKVFVTAKERLAELRISLNKEQQRLLAESKNRPVQAGDKTVKTTGLSGDMGLAEEIAKQKEAVATEFSEAGKTIVRAASQAINQGAREEGQTGSDSKVTSQIGKDHSSGFSTGLRSKKDEASKAGEEAGEAVAEGARRGGKGRVRTAGPTTPGEEIRFDILNGKVVEAAAQVSGFSSNLGAFAGKVINMGNKIGMVGIGLSSLVGVLGRVEGPVGDLANNLFPVISALTGLSFALRMVNAETATKFVTDKAKGVQDAVIAAREAKDHALDMSQKAVERTATARQIVATNASSAALGRFVLATNAATFSALGQSAGGFGNLLGRFGKGLSGALGKIVGGISRVFGRLGGVVSAVFRGFSVLIGGLLGLIGTTAMVATGLLGLVGIAFLVAKAMKDQKAKIDGLGNAAKLSGDKIKTLNEILGSDIRDRQARESVGGTADSGTGARLGDDDAQAAALGIQDQLLDSDEFKKEFKGTISALKGAGDEAVEQTIMSMALSLKTAGASDEMIAGIVNALLVSAGKTDIVLDFSSITVGTAQQSAQDAATDYADQFTNTVVEANRYEDRFNVDSLTERASTGAGSGSSMFIGSIGGADVEQQRQLAAGAFSSLIMDAADQLEAGEIGVDEYTQAISGIGETLRSIGSQDAEGLLAASLLVAQMAQNMKEAGFEDVGEDVQGFLDLNTAAGLDSATTVMAATAAGREVTDDEISVLQTGAAEGATATQVEAAKELTEEIEKQTAANLEAINVEKEAKEQRDAAAAFQTELGEQNDALREQIDTYDEVSGAIQNNNDIQDKNAFARKVAADETLRQEFALARQVDATNGNTAAVDSFVAALTEQGALQDELAAKEAVTGLDADISELQEQIATYDEALDAASGLVDETEAQAIAYKISADAALQQAFAVAQATDAAKGNTDATAALITNLALEAELRGQIADISGVATGRGRGGGGSRGPESSFLDGITKRMNLFSNAQISVTKGWEASMQAILDFANVAGNLDGTFNGLNKQLRGLDLNENLIEMITGMDPDEYEKRKHELFIFDDRGNIIGMTEKLKSLNAALNAVVVGEFIDTQQQLTNSVSNQVTAIDKLTAAGASYEAAYRAVQNTAFAAAIATAASSAQIKAAADAAMEAERMMKKMAERNEEEQRQKGISDAVKKMNKDFSNQAKILDYINRNRKTLRESQITELLNDQNLQALVLEPSINPGALREALDNAAKRADLELKIKKLTIEGQQEIFEDGMGLAMDAFNARSKKIEFDFEASIKNEKDIIKQAEEELALLNFELQTYEDGLKDIGFQEDEINKAYENRFDALDRIAEANAEISRQQQAQLDVADALSRGDIAGAARAVREARAASGEAAREQERRKLETAQEAQIAALTSKDGLTKDQLEERSLEIEKQIFEIERGRINPAQELVRLAELKRDADIESLEVLGKTREEYEKMSNRIDIARAGNWKTVEAMQEALDIVETLVTELGKSKPLPPPPPVATAPAPRRSSGGSSKPAPTPAPQTYTVKPGDWLSKIAPRHGISTAALIKANPQIKNHDLIFPGQQINIPGKASGGMIIPKRMAGGGPAYPVRRMAGGSMVKGYPLGGLIPYSSVGGPFPSLGSDTIPAMLTPGEFVIRRPAVREIGVDKLENLNRNASMGGDVYNYSVSVNVKSESDADRIARTVIDQIKRIDSQRIRGNTY